MKFVCNPRERRELDASPLEQFPNPSGACSFSLATTPYEGVFPEDAEMSSISGPQRKSVSGAGSRGPLFQRQLLQQDRHDVLAAATDRDASLDPIDVVQAGLGVVGMADFFPPVATAADSLNAAISLWRGDPIGAALGAASMIPGLGLGAGVANIVHHLKPIEILISSRASKELKKIPKEIGDSLRKWADDVRDRGLQEVRKTSGYNDYHVDYGEHQGSRAIRLNRSYRAVYTELDGGSVRVEAVNKHGIKFK